MFMEIGDVSRGFCRNSWKKHIRDSYISRHATCAAQSGLGKVCDDCILSLHQASFSTAYIKMIASPYLPILPVYLQKAHVSCQSLTNNTRWNIQLFYRLEMTCSDQPTHQRKAVVLKKKSDHICSCQVDYLMLNLLHNLSWMLDS